MSMRASAAAGGIGPDPRDRAASAPVRPTAPDGGPASARPSAAREAPPARVQAPSARGTTRAVPRGPEPDDRAAEAERLVSAYSDAVFRVARAYLGSVHDAEDICQEVLCRLLGLGRPGARRFADTDHERAWVLRCAVNACKDVLKSARRRRVTGFADVGPGNTGSWPAIDGSPTPEEAVVSAPGAGGGPAPDDRARLLAAVDALPPAYRVAIHLHYFEGLGARQIAAITGEREPTVYAHLSRARAKLRRALGGEDR